MRCGLNVLYLNLTILMVILVAGRLLNTLQPGSYSEHVSPRQTPRELRSPAAPRSSRPTQTPTGEKPSRRKAENPKKPVFNNHPLFQSLSTQNKVNATFDGLVQQIKDDIFNRSNSRYITFKDYQEFTSRVNQVRGIRVPPRSSFKRMRHEPSCNKRRKRLIREACAAGVPHIKPAREWTNADAERYSSHLSNIVVDDKHKLLFCDIPKAGSTSWKVAIALLTGLVLKQDILNRNYMVIHSPYYMARLGLYYLSSAHPKLIRKKLKRYYKFLVVRHPLDRLVSAYNDKFVHRDPPRDWYDKMQKAIKERYREEDADQNATVSFREFVNYAADDDSIEDRHWLSYQYLCGPCVVDYDYVMKVESLEQDVSYVLPSIFKEPGVSTLPEVHSHRGASRARRAYKELREFFNVTKQETQRLVDGPYKWDLPMFGYRFDAEAGRATCDKYTKDGQCC